SPQQKIDWFCQESIQNAGLASGLMPTACIGRGRYPSRFETLPAFSVWRERGGLGLAIRSGVIVGAKSAHPWPPAWTKMICAALQAPQPSARTSTRTPTRTSFSLGRPLHPKCAHTILSSAHIILPGRAHHFALGRTPFCLEAQAISGFCLTSRASPLFAMALLCGKKV